MGFLYLFLLTSRLVKTFLFNSPAILGDPGAECGGKGKSKQAGKYGTKKSKERLEEPLGTMSYQTSSKRSPPSAILASDWCQKNKSFLSCIYPLFMFLFFFPVSPDCDFSFGMCGWTGHDDWRIHKG